jgi:hypothetical protein
MTKHKDWLGEAGTVTSRRRLKDASLYGKMFPKPKGENVTIKRDAGVKHTVKFIPQVVEQTLDQTERIARELVAPTFRQTCRNIWQWVYDHIRYEKDETGKEQVRSPARLFYDRKGDCDCYTTFIDSVLANVSRIKKWPMKITNRITKYGGTGFQHIYPIVESPDGERIVLDCVTEFFDYEEPYSEKEDHKVMELEYLNGIDGEDLFGAEARTEFPYADDAVGELGKFQLFKRKKEKEAEKKQPEATKEKGKVVTAIKKVVHAVNKVNPATLLLRNGLLASMKLNVLNVAGRLKWTYLSADEAKKKGLDMERWAKTVKVREKLDKIFFGAGGEPENLKKAILSGKGNNGKEVNGLGVVPIYALGESGMSVRDIIGAEIFDRENAHLSGLGEPVTAATLAAASAAVATLAQILKQIGPLKAGQDTSENPDAAGETLTPDETAPSGDGENERDASPKFLDDPIAWAKANPGKAALAGVGIAVVLYGGYKWYQSSQEKKDEGKSSRTKREEVYHVPLSE